MKSMPVVLFTVVALSAAGCGKQQDTPAAPAPAPQGAPPVTGVAPAPNAAPEPSAGLEALLRDRATRYAPSALWKNRLGRFLLARGQGDEAALLLEAAAAADPGNADFRLDALLIRASRAGSMQGPDVAQVSALLGEPAPHAQGAVAGSAAVGPANSMAPPLAPAPPGAAGHPARPRGPAPRDARCRTRGPTGCRGAPRAGTAGSRSGRGRAARVAGSGGGAARGSASVLRGGSDPRPRGRSEG